MEDRNLSRDEEVIKMEIIDKNIKFRAFGKTKPYNAKDRKPIPVTPVTTEEETNLVILRRQSKTIEDATEEVKTQKHSKVGVVLKMLELIKGPLQ